MMKNKVYSTTDFYKNPSKVLNYVKDGGVVYLGYKKLKEPIAVLTTYKDYTERKASLKQRSGNSLFSLSGKKAISAPEYTDSLGYIHKLRKKR